MDISKLKSGGKLLLLCGMLMFASTMHAHVFDNYDDDTFTYSLIDSAARTIRVTGLSVNYTGGSSTLLSPEIPEYLYDYDDTKYTVTEIADRAFYGQNKLFTVKMPATLVKIGKGAFAECTHLNSISIPDSVISIENGVFNGCSSLSLVYCGKSIESIGSGAFQNCSAWPLLLCPPQ